MENKTGAEVSPACSKPLAGIRVVEIEALGPVPWACMVLADLGADIVRIERPGTRTAKDTYGSVLRGRKRLELDLKTDTGRQQLLSLIEKADVLVEGMRPGAMERLNLGPQQVFYKNRHIIFGRMTGWGQQGPLSAQAGHDINYIAVSGILDSIGSKEKPAIPLNIIGDFAGGGCFLLTGILSSLVRPKDQRQDIIIDCAMVDGASVLMSLIYSRYSLGQWVEERESNPLDGGVPWYDTYHTRDKKRIAVGALEPKFYDNLIIRLGLKQSVPDRNNKANWPTIRRVFTDAFMTKTRDEWVDFFEGIDACVSPVLSLSEAPLHPHLQDRGTVLRDGDELVPGPAPIFGESRLAVSKQSLFTDFAEVEAGWS